MTPVRAVLFDAVGTLMRPQPAVAAAYVSAAALQGIVVEEAETSRRFRAAFAAEEQVDALAKGRTDAAREVGRWRRIVAAVFPVASTNDPAASERLFVDLWEHFAEPAHWELFEDVAPAIRALTAHAPDLRLGLASNFDSRLHGICQHLEVLSVCRQRFVSAELGWKKPSPAFFRAIEQALNLEPHEILLIGDDLDNDYRAARGAGWQALWLDRSAAAEMGEVRAPRESTITSLVPLVERADLVASWRKR